MRSWNPDETPCHFCKINGADLITYAEDHVRVFSHFDCADKDYHDTKRASARSIRWHNSKRRKSGPKP